MATCGSVLPDAGRGTGMPDHCAARLVAPLARKSDADKTLTAGCTPTRDHRKSKQVRIQPDMCADLPAKTPEIALAVSSFCKVIRLSQRNAEEALLVTDSGQANFRVSRTRPGSSTSCNQSYLAVLQPSCNHGVAVG
eukprot:3398765-Pleurochrysis_carterae.AAC.2